MNSFHTRVVVRSRNRLHDWTVLTTEQAPWEIQAEWTDSNHLLVTYPSWNQDGSTGSDPDFHCGDAGAIHVTCLNRLMSPKGGT